MPRKHRSRKSNINNENKLVSNDSSKSLNTNSNLEENKDYPSLVIKQTETKTLLKINNAVSNSSFDELIKIYKNTQYHTSNKKDLDYLANIRKLVNFYISNYQYAIPCFRCAKSDKEDNEYKSGLSELIDYKPVSERKVLINNIVVKMIQNCIDSSTHNLEIHNVPLFMLDINPYLGVGVTENKFSFAPITVNFIHDFFKAAGPINMLMQASDNTYYIWYADDNTAISVYNYLNDKGCNIDGTLLSFKLRVRDTTNVAWSKPIKI